MIQYVMAKLDKIFGIKKGDVVSIVGAGGKTSLLYTLGDYFENSLMTTTTKLFVPDDRNYNVGTPSSVDGSLIVAKEQLDDKLYGFTPDELKEFYSMFDYTFIEADGARMMNLKAWSENEPVICNYSNKTIGVLDIKTIGLRTSETVFRINEFEKITSIEEVVSLHNLKDIVLNENGLFKFSDFKILYINKVELTEDAENAFKLIELLLKDERFNIDRIVIGSIHNGMFEEVYKSKGVFVLASGLSKRMGEDKLSISYKGLPLIEHTLKKLSKYPEDVYLVTSDHRFNSLADDYGIDVLVNLKNKEGQSSSIKRSLELDYHFYTYFLGDMPNLTEDTVSALVKTKTDLLACGDKEMFSAPATLSKKYKAELLSLKGDQGAKKVLRRYVNKVEFTKVLEEELFDIDTKEDLEVF